MKMLKFTLFLLSMQIALIFKHFFGFSFLYESPIRVGDKKLFRWGGVILFRIFWFLSANNNLKK